MSRVRFDQLAKQYLEGCFEPLGVVERQFEVPGEPKFIDVWFVPTPRANQPLEDWGVLNRMAQTACVLEPFRNPPSRSEIRTSLLKLLWIQDDLRRKAEADHRSVREEELPLLWILASSLRRPIVAELGGQVRAEWGQGFYFLAGLLRVAIVVIDELPTTQETLWLRILGQGEVQEQAILEVLNLPKDDLRRIKVLKLLAIWRVKMDMNELVLEEQQEEGLMAALSEAYLQWEEQTKQEGRREGLQKGLQEGLQKGLQKGHREERRSLVRLQLNQKFNGLPDRLAKQIRRLSLKQLERLAVALLNFGTIADLETWLSQPENQPKPKPKKDDRGTATSPPPNGHSGESNS